MTDDGKRFSDQQLQDFYDEFVDHTTREHVIQESLTAAIEQNNKLVQEIREDTQGLLNAWQTASGGVRFFRISGKVVMWLAGVVTAIGAIWYTITHGFQPPK